VCASRLVIISHLFVEFCLSFFLLSLCAWMPAGDLSKCKGETEMNKEGKKKKVWWITLYPLAKDHCLYLSRTLRYHRTRRYPIGEKRAIWIASRFALLKKRWWWLWRRASGHSYMILFKALIKSVKKMNNNDCIYAFGVVKSITCNFCISAAYTSW